MEAIISVAIVGIFVLYFVFREKSEDIIKSSPPPPLKSKPLSRETLKNINQNMRDNNADSIKKEDVFTVTKVSNGYSVFEDGSHFIQGVTYRKQNCIDWATGDNLSLSWKREPNNKYDSNAIAIYGKSSNGNKKIGYIAAEIADILVYEELTKGMKVNLLSVEIKDTPFIQYEIWVKSDVYSKYDK